MLCLTNLTFSYEICVVHIKVKYIVGIDQEYMGGMEYEGSHFPRVDIELKILYQHSLRPSHP